MTSALFTKVGMRPPEALELARSAELLRSETAAGVALGTGQGAALKVAPELLLHAQRVRVAFFDVDGVLTDGGLYMSEDGEILKRFNTLDGHGIKLLQKAGITPAIITGRDSPALRARLLALGITHAHFGTEDKWPAAEITLRALGLDWAAAAAMGGRLARSACDAPCGLQLRTCKCTRGGQVAGPLCYAGARRPWRGA